LAGVEREVGPKRAFQESHAINYRGTFVQVVNAGYACTLSQFDIDAVEVTPIKLVVARYVEHWL
jgi:hypothetical protein